MTSTLAFILVFGFALPISMLILSIYRDRKRAQLARKLAEAEADRKRREAERKAAAAKRAAQEAEYRRYWEAEAQKVAKAAKAAERKAAQQAKEEERKAAAEARHAETMRRREELHQQKMRHLAELQAAQDALKAAQAATQADAEKGHIEEAHKAAEQVKEAEKEQPDKAEPEPRKDPQQTSKPGNPAPFAGETVAFTGTCPKMERRYMVSHVNRLGGHGYETINTRCTLLVVGEKPGKNQLDKAAKWNIPTITWSEWWERAFNYPAYVKPQTISATPIN